MKECFELAKIIKNLYPKIELIDLKYFALQIYESVECTQREINEKKEVRITDRCQIYDDIVLARGTKLVFDHALVRIYGNILLDGGTLEIINSKFIRKSDSHRACINVKDAYSRVIVENVRQTAEITECLSEPKQEKLVLKILIYTIPQEVLRYVSGEKN